MSGKVFELKEREFKPSPRMKTIYWLYSLWYFIPAILFITPLCYNTLRPVIAEHGFNLASHPVVSALTTVLLLVIVFIIGPAIAFGVWLSLYYKSILFRVEEDHVYSRKGVLWVKEKRVPYNLVSEVRFRQGPVQRVLGLANIDVFTPATGVRRPELSLFQVDAGRAQDLISYLRYRTGILSSRERRVLEEDMLKELKKIRELLEEILDRL